ncbi:MAG TPA: hypothetical protein VFR18_04175 [Terriglobia bacterium]|nr:hypothetical protein [Terriglobia bacterium]
MKNVAVGLVMVMALTTGCLAQDQTPGAIVLLSGYKHQKIQGTDSFPGRIRKDNGLEIEYDIGGLTGNFAEQILSRTSGKKPAWSKEQTMRGMRVVTVLTTDRWLIVTFSSLPPGLGRSSQGVWALPANFSAKVNSDEDIADMLSMIMTYSPASQ